MTLKMRAEVRDAWADALESGDYEQTKGVLATAGAGQGFCCLGVLCDLAVEAGVIPEPVVTASDEYGDCLLYGTGDTSYSGLPDAVITWAGLRDDDGLEVYDPRLTAPDGTRLTAAHWNDGHGATFADIAGMVRAIEPAPELVEAGE